MPNFAHAQTGAEIVNTANVSFQQGPNRLTTQTNDAVFIIEPARTTSTIEFLRFAPTAVDGVPAQINGSQFSPNGELAGPFVDIGAPVTSNGLVLDLSGPVVLAPASQYLAGELLFVQVIDPGQNSAPGIVESLVIEVTTDTGDTITLRLFETGPDTGEFCAFIPSTPNLTPANDALLSTPNSTSLTATYVDSFDASDVSIDVAAVDPLGRVFDGLTGAPLNGARVTLIDVATGQPAGVFGVDGVSAFPSTVITGSVVTDASGLQYPLGAGEYTFPQVPPGTYELQIEPLLNYVFPSTLSVTDIAGLPNGPFTIVDGSFGGEFTNATIGPLNFDIPLDSAGELIVTKDAGSPTTAVGDFVGYTVRVENRDSVPSVLRLVDTLPRGFRYEAGSARIDGVRIADPDIGPDGRTLTFEGTPILSGGTRSLTYVTLVSAGAPLGDAVNEIVAVDSLDQVISNRAEAVSIVREDLLRSRLTIIGRVAEQACEVTDEWARETVDGIGVGGVRLYLETGDYVVTDADGLYHFENVLPGTHVVQVDTETLPAGYDAVVCEENSRYAGSAISKFVDAIGGTIWRANFYLKRTGDAAIETATEEFNDGVEHLDYDLDWLETQTSDVEWVYPNTDRTPSTKSINLGIKHGGSDSVSLSLNGAPVSARNYGGSDTSADASVAISRWRGVDIENGRNLVKAVITNQDGKTIAELEETIWFVSSAERVTLVDDQSALVADGRTNPVVSVRITDGAGRPVHAGRRVEVNIAAPYRLEDTERFEGEAPVSAALSNLTSIAVGPDGIAHVRLAPTLETGRLRLLVQLDSGDPQKIDVFLRPEKRDWILVGLAEGSLGLERLDGPGAVNANDLLNDGRLAFFAKGVIRGDWLLTLAVDTSSRRGEADGDLFEGQIDPNAFYTLYGDRTFQGQEAQSRYPLYVKLEKETFQILFGDYDTDFNETELARYNRRLSGLKTVYEGKTFSFSAFAAETNQGFSRDELAADGTSGPFVLSNAPLLRNSETIIVETRDRFRPDEINGVTNLARYVDYDIDFDTGEIIFRRPISATDENFDPNVIVVEYETSAAVERNITAGGRVSARAFDGRVEVGATYIREEGDDVQPDAKSQLAGVDFTAQIDQYTELHAEYAITLRDDAAEEQAGDDNADAFLVEIVRRQEAVTVAAYFREDEAGFGLGQQSSSTIGARRYGANASVAFGGGVTDTGQHKAQYTANAEAYREESLSTGDTRTLAEANIHRQSPFIGASIGIRNVEEDFETNGEGSRRSTLLTSSVNKHFESLGLNLTAAHEQPIAGDESSSFPQRTILGLDKSITQKATVNVRHEILRGDNASGNNTVVGVTVQPFSGTTVTGTADLITQDSARRIGATVGVDQIIRINDKWSAGVGLARRANISDNTGEVLDVVPDAALSPLETAPASPLTGSDQFTSLYTGLGYRGEKSAVSGRVELRDSAISTRYSGTLGAAREANDQLSYAFAARWEQDQPDEASNRLRADARLGLSYRPRAKGPVVYDRFDVSYERVSNESTNWKVVNNIGVNALIGRRTQVAAFHGFKYSETTFFGDSFSEVTNLVGGEVRFDVTKKLDIGLAGSALISSNGQIDYQIGPSIGYSPVDNTWMSVGWNIAGFEDNDFEAAEFSRDGPFIKLRVKFDQHTARGLLDRISPQGR